MFKISVCVTVIAIAALVLGRDFRPEKPCNAVGGLCVLGTDCPQEDLAGSGLCPEQQSQGAECCRRVPPSYKNCSNHGGSCEDSCPPAILRSDLVCPVGKSCCIWL